MQIVAIEANIAAGKTTLLEPLAQALSKQTGSVWTVVREPVDEDPVFLELLQLFVESPNDADARVASAIYHSQPPGAVEQYCGGKLCD